jgi:hypothetical protein
VRLQGVRQNPLRGFCLTGRGQARKGILKMKGKKNCVFLALCFFFVLASCTGKDGTTTAKDEKKAIIGKWCFEDLDSGIWEFTETNFIAYGIDAYIAGEPGITLNYKLEKNNLLLELGDGRLLNYTVEFIDNNTIKFSEPHESDGEEPIEEEWFLRSFRMGGVTALTGKFEAPAQFSTRTIEFIDDSHLRYINTDSNTPYVWEYEIRDDKLFINIGANQFWVFDIYTENLFLGHGGSDFAVYIKGERHSR